MAKRAKSAACQKQTAPPDSNTICPSRSTFEYHDDISRLPDNIRTAVTYIVDKYYASKEVISINLLFRHLDSIVIKLSDRLDTDVAVRFNDVKDDKIYTVTFMHRHEVVGWVSLFTITFIPNNYKKLVKLMKNMFWKKTYARTLIKTDTVTYRKRVYTVMRIDGGEDTATMTVTYRNQTLLERIWDMIAFPLRDTIYEIKAQMD